MVRVPRSEAKELSLLDRGFTALCYLSLIDFCEDVYTSKMSEQCLANLPYVSIELNIEVQLLVRATIIA